MSRLKVFYIVIGIAALFYRVCSGTGLTVTPDPSQVVTSEGDVINLLCKASERPSICLWKTPYQAIYTVGGGRIWEQGRLSSSPLAENGQCGLVIAGIQSRDRGVWQCEVGAVVDGEFTTTTAETTISVIDKAAENPPGRLLGLEGDEITIPCLSNGKRGVCRWSSPYGQSYSLMPGDYAERGRLLADVGCRLRISNLQGRDDGAWTCQVGDGRVSETTTRLTIETPLKLSAPTSILQQADERATLVCHANKEYGRCEWETPYGRTVSFSKNNRQAESGRLQYFGFSEMDCGIVIRDIGPRDSGGWTCRVSAKVAGKDQISADIVRLFVEPTQYEDQREEPRSIQSSSPDYTIDYRALDYNQDESKMDDYDAFDYVNGDFDKVVKGLDDYDQATNNREEFSTSSKSPPRVELNPTKVSTPENPTSKPEVLRTIEEDDGFIREIQKIGKFGTVRIDRIPDRDQRRPTTSANPFVAFRDEPRSFNEPSSTSPPISNTHQNFPAFPAVEESVEDHTVQSSLNPSELDFLELISGSRVDNRPFRIANNSQFGIRQSSVSGSSFQFGDIHLVGNNGNLPVNGGQAEEEISQERRNNPRELITADVRNQNNVERPIGRQKVRIRTQGKSAAEREREKENEERIQLENKLVEERARIAEEKLNRQRLQLIEERKKQRLLEEEERRIKLRKLREQQIEESRKLQEERERKRLEAELAKQRQEEEEAAIIKEEERRVEEKRQKELKEERERKLALEKFQKEREKQLQEERERRLQVQIEKLKKEREEQRKLELEEIERKQILKEQKALEEERRRKILEERERQLREEREKRMKEERERKRKEEIDRKRKEEQDRKQKEEKEKKIKEEKEEKEKEIKREKNKLRRQEEERERQLKEQLEKARLEEEVKKQLEIDEKKKQIEAEEEKEKLKEIEDRRNIERDRIRQDLFDQRKKEEQEERRKKLQEQRQRRINEEKERNRQEEIRKIQEDNEKAIKMQKEAERRLQLEKERIRQEEIENERKELEEKKKKQEEEERLSQIQRAHEENVRKERKRLREEAEIRRRKEQQELQEIKKKDEERKQEIQLLRDLQAQRDRHFQEERENKRKEVEEEKKKKEEELEMVRKRDEARKEELEKLRNLQLERERILKTERERLSKENELQRQKEERENEKLKEQAIERKKEIETLRALQLQREGQLKSERERIRKQKAELEKQQIELQRQKELLERIRKEQERAKQLTTTTPKPPPTPAAKELKKCLINPWPESGNITCLNTPLARGNYIVKSGNKCHLTCKKGFVTLDAKETECQNGRWSHKLYCVQPGAMLVVGGRSDTYGVLSSVELVTSGGVCRNIIPNLPTMRWKMVSASIDADTVVACGGINFLGDPKTDCWRLDFSGAKPRWTAMQSLSVPRDAAAWAAEEGKLFVMGGSLGTLSGYTDSTEVYDPSKEEWVVGESLTSRRASHCAVGDGEGHIIVTGGYGALQSVQRLDIKTGVWTNLPDLQPVRAQHGCAFVELMGKKGVIIVGGDSGGTRLNDVRFLSLEQPNPSDWTKIADLNTARWGRPSVGTIGGKITVIGGWDGVKALNSIEFYNEKNQRWETSRRTKLSTERRWAASAQVSNKLFPTCVAKRS